MSFFHQTHFVTLNAKGRFVLPAMFRKDADDEILRGNFWILPSTKAHNLIIRPEPVWNQYIKQIADADLDTSTKREYLETINATVQKADIDSQNRMFLSPIARGILFGDLQEGPKEIVVIGEGLYFEICDKARFPGIDTYIKRLPEIQKELESQIDLGVH